MHTYESKTTYLFTLNFDYYDRILLRLYTKGSCSDKAFS